MKIAQLASVLTILWFSALTLCGIISYWSMKKFFPQKLIEMREKFIESYSTTSEKPTTIFGYFRRNFLFHFIALLLLTVIFKAPFALRISVFAYVILCNMLLCGAALGIAIAVKNSIPASAWAKYLLQHGIFEIAGHCTIWAMILLGLCAIPWLSIAVILIFIAAWTEARISDPYLDRLMGKHYSKALPGGTEFPGQECATSTHPVPS